MLGADSLEAGQEAGAEATASQGDGPSVWRGSGPGTTQGARGVTAIGGNEKLPHQENSDMQVQDALDS